MLCASVFPSSPSYAGQAVARVVDVYMGECVYAASHLLIFSCTHVLMDSQAPGLSVNYLLYQRIAWP